jgi:prepilin-type N-terminal cleavage/methylation domain-containing protein
MKASNQTGFTAVELMITLFIASIFLLAGYQLYAQVTSDGAEAEASVRVSNVIQERLRKDMADFKAAAPSGCNLSTPTVSTESATYTGIGSMTMTITRRCPIPPDPSLTNLYQVTVGGTYTESGSSKTVRYSTYAN